VKYDPGLIMNTNISLRDVNEYPNYLKIYWNYFVLPSLGYWVFVALLLSRNRSMRKALMRKCKSFYWRPAEVASKNGSFGLNIIRDNSEAVDIPLLQIKTQKYTVDTC